MLDLSGVTNTPEDSQIIPIKHTLESVKQLFESYDNEFFKLHQRAKELEVTDDESAALATEMMGQASSFVKKLESERKEITKNEDAFVRGVNSIVRAVRVKVEGIIKTLKDEKIGPYNYRKILQQREEERKAEIARREAQAEIDRIAKEKNVETVQIPEQKIPKKPEPIRTAAGTASTRMVQDYEVIDESIVDRKYLMINHAKIKADMNAGITEMSGIRIFERPETRVRTN